MNRNIASLNLTKLSGWCFWGTCVFMMMLLCSSDCAPCGSGSRFRCMWLAVCCEVCYLMNSSTTVVANVNIEIQNVGVMYELPLAVD